MYIFIFIGSRITVFPQELTEQGLYQKTLSSTLEQLQAGCVDHSWKLHTTPNIGFYRKLHTYLKQQPNLSKVLIGKFYCVIDGNLQKKGGRPDNIYRFVDTIVASDRHSDDSMVYSFPVSLSSMMKKCSRKVEELNAECMELRAKIEASKSQQSALKRTLCDATKENQDLRRKCNLSKAKFDKLRCENEQLEAHCIRLEEENFDLQEESSDCDISLFQPDDVEPTASGSNRKYSPEIRKIYYSLLENEVPVSKITDIVRSVVKCFNPSLDMEQLQLPKSHALAT